MVIMEIFSAILKEARRQKDILVCLWVPENIELQDIVLHGQELQIDGNIKDTIAAYEGKAAKSMFEIIEEKFPGKYILDIKYQKR